MFGIFTGQEAKERKETVQETCRCRTSMSRSGPQPWQALRDQEPSFADYDLHPYWRRDWNQKSIVSIAGVDRSRPVITRTKFCMRVRVNVALGLEPLARCMQEWRAASHDPLG